MRLSAPGLKRQTLRYCEPHDQTRARGAIRQWSRPPECRWHRCASERARNRWSHQRAASAGNSTEPPEILVIKLVGAGFAGSGRGIAWGAGAGAVLGFAARAPLPGGICNGTGRVAQVRSCAKQAQAVALPGVAAAGAGCLSGVLIFGAGKGSAVVFRLPVLPVWLWKLPAVGVRGCVWVSEWIRWRSRCAAARSRL